MASVVVRPHSRRPGHHQVRVLGEVEIDRRQVQFRYGPSDSARADALAGVLRGELAKLLHPERRRQPAHGRSRGAGDPADGFDDAVGLEAVVRRAGQRGSRHQRVQAGLRVGIEANVVDRDHATTRLDRNVLGEPGTYQLGIFHGGQPQLDTGAETAAHRRPQFRFAIGGDHHVHPERGALVDDHVHLLDQHLVFLGQRPVVVDHQVDVAEPVVGYRTGLVAELAAPEHLHRGDPVLEEGALALPHQGEQFGHRATNTVGVGRTGHLTDVGQAGDRGQRGAAVGQAVELDLLGSMGQRRRTDQRLQRGGLTRTTGTQNQNVGTGPGRVDRPRRLVVLEGTVDDPDREHQIPRGAVVLLPGVTQEPVHQLVDGDGRGSGAAATGGTAGSRSCVAGR